MFEVLIIKTFWLQYSKKQPAEPIFVWVYKNGRSTSKIVFVYEGLLKIILV